MSETKTLQERLRKCAQRCQMLYDEEVGSEVTFQGAAWRLGEAAEALDAKDALLREARGALNSVRADEKTFRCSSALTLRMVDSLLLKLTEATK